MSTCDERARQRASWPLRRFTLGQEPAVDERDTTTAAERIQLAMRLTREQWTAAGLPWPTCRRDDMPGRLLRKQP